jgi:hypothetical protein
MQNFRGNDFYYDLGKQTNLVLQKRLFTHEFTWSWPFRCINIVSVRHNLSSNCMEFLMITDIFYVLPIAVNPCNIHYLSIKYLLVFDLCFFLQNNVIFHLELCHRDNFYLVLSFHKTDMPNPERIMKTRSSLLVWWKIKRCRTIMNSKL